MFKGKEQKEREEQERIAAEQRQKESRDRKYAAHLESFRNNVRKSVTSGVPVHLYMDIYVPVDAQMNEFGPPTGLYLAQVNHWGMLGWDVVSVVPRTYGGFQSYKVSKTTAYGVSGWGKDTHQTGLGGHIVGVYVLMHYVVDSSNLDASDEAIDTAAKRDAEQLAGFAEG